MPEIKGFNKIVMGDTSDVSTARGRALGVSHLIMIVEELTNRFDKLDLSALNDLNALTPEITNHLNDSIIHITESMKEVLAEIIVKYNDGSLGGTGSGGGGVVLYNTSAELLSSTPTVHGTLGAIESEGANLYFWNNVSGKWVVKDGNAYLTANLPSDTNFEIITGTELIDLNTGERIVWS